MTFRLAETSDIPEIVEMARDFHRHNGPKWPFDEDAMSDVVGKLIASPSGFVALDRGFIIGAIQPNPISPSWIIAKEFLWWSHGGGLGLLSGFRAWAKSHHADEIQMSCPVGERAEVAFKRHGAAQEIIYSEICHVH